MRFSIKSNRFLVSVFGFAFVSFLGLRADAQELVSYEGILVPSYGIGDPAVSVDLSLGSYRVSMDLSPELRAQFLSLLGHSIKIYSPKPDPSAIPGPSKMKVVKYELSQSYKSLEGQLTTDVMTIGGEGTGRYLKLSNGNIQELLVDYDLFDKAMKLATQQGREFKGFKVRGVESKMSWVERQDVPVLIVESITPQ